MIPLAGLLQSTVTNFVKLSWKSLSVQLIFLTKKFASQSIKIAD